jgi:hypothetical protein
MATAVETAINDSKRLPNMVWTAHVHNYQRIERTIAAGVILPFIVAGNGGYYHLHKLNAPAGITDSSTGAHLIAGQDTHWGYLTLTVNGQNIAGTTTTVPNAGATATPAPDSFSYPAAAQYVPAGVVVRL